MLSWQLTAFHQMTAASSSVAISDSMEQEEVWRRGQSQGAPPNPEAPKASTSWEGHRGGLAKSCNNGRRLPGQIPGEVNRATASGRRRRKKGGGGESFGGLGGGGRGRLHLFHRKTHHRHTNHGPPPGIATTHYLERKLSYFCYQCGLTYKIVIAFWLELKSFYPRS